jgi:zinc transport system substrate-binding protein
MKNLLLLILGVLIFASCSNIKDSEEQVITTSIIPFRYFTTAIAGPNFIVNVIVPPGASPATFEPTPNVINELHKSKVLILDGYLGYELAWAEKLKGVNPDIETLILSDSQNLFYGEEHKHGDHVHLSGVDPHFWTSPKSALIIAGDILEFLKVSFPDRVNDFEANYLILKDEIISTGNYLDSLFLSLERRTFMIFHPSLTYLARDYNLVQVAVETDGKEPTPAGLKEFIDIGRNENIGVIFVQREFDRKNAETIAQEIGAEVVEIDPLSENWPLAVRTIGKALAESLQDQQKR